MIISITLIAVELGLITMQLADAIESKTGNNFIQDGFGWNQSKYDKIRTGLIIVKVVLIVELFIHSLLRFQCFAKDTKVLTKEGSKPIEEIEIDDEVLSFNEETGETDFKEVVRLFRNKARQKCQLQFDCEKEPIICIPEHPFYILNATADTPIVMFEGRDDSNFEGQWVAAKYLKAGDKCFLSGGKTAILTDAKTEQCDEFDTYNFEVTDFHTYYVGESGVLCHNMCAGADIQYPPNNGAVPGTEKIIDLQPGTYGRYGNIGETSKFITQAGASPSQLSLPPGTNPAIYTEITVLKPIPGVTQSVVAPWAPWGGVGGGTQYVLPKSIIQLKGLGYLTF